MANLIDQLRQGIDAKHDNAVRALETIRAYLDEVPLAGNGISHASGRARHARRAPIRDHVLAIVRERSASIDEMVEATGLERRQVRGVINAPDLKGRITRQDINGVIRYRFNE